MFVDDKTYNCALTLNALWDKAHMSPEEWVLRMRAKQRENKRREEKTPGAKERHATLRQRQKKNPVWRVTRNGRTRRRYATRPDVRAKEIAYQKARNNSPLAKALRKAMRTDPNVVAARKALL